MYVFKLKNIKYPIKVEKQLKKIHLKMLIYYAVFQLFNIFLFKLGNIVKK